MKTQGTRNASAPAVRLGERIVVDEIRMTCTGIVATLSGREYEFSYFSGGAMTVWRVTEGDFTAFGWRRDGRKAAIRQGD